MISARASWLSVWPWWLPCPCGTVSRLRATPSLPPSHSQLHQSLILWKPLRQDITLSDYWGKPLRPKEKTQLPPRVDSEPGGGPLLDDGHLEAAGHGMPMCKMFL